MSTGLQYDEEASRRVEAMYMTPDVVAQRHEVLRVLELCEGERVVDVGSGPGFLAADMGMKVGATGRVCGIDVSESMIAMSQTRCTDQPWIEFRVGDATHLPFPDADCDVAISTQVYEYVSDVATALAELHRVLRPGGRALILDTDWDSMVWHTTDQARMDRILAAWNDHLVDPYLPRTLTQKLKHAGFQVQRSGVIPLLNAEYDENTYSYGLIGLIGAFVIDRCGITKEDVEAWSEDLHLLGEEGTYFFSLNRYYFTAMKPDAVPST